MRFSENIDNWPNGFDQKAACLVLLLPIFILQVCLQYTHTPVQLLVSECFCSCIYASVSQTEDICQLLLFDLD